MNGRAQKFRYLPLTLLAVVVLVAGSGVYLMVRHFLHAAPPQTKKVVQEIHIIRPPPPPPDEPPPPPPPPEEKVDVHEPEPEPDPTPSNEPPPSEQLGLDAEGGAGGDAFGLVGHKGGRDLLASGGSALAWYGGLVKNRLLDCLQSDKDVRKGGAYSVDVEAWVREDGTVERIRLEKSTGDRQRDKAIEAQSSGCRISEPPPAGMPQPIRLRIVSRA
ncbi:MAG TPA: energy transducer TonB [Steroidobacteraceae bacterium]|nr:energy transducer TonB [Steroidobacteraceae bacterium]